MHTGVCSNEERKWMFWRKWIFRAELTFVLSFILLEAMLRPVGCAERSLRRCGFTVLPSVCSFHALAIGTPGGSGGVSEKHKILKEHVYLFQLRHTHRVTS